MEFRYFSWTDSNFGPMLDTAGKFKTFIQNNKSHVNLANYIDCIVGQGSCS